MLTPLPAMEDHHHTLINQSLKPQETEEQLPMFKKQPTMEEQLLLKNKPELLPTVDQLHTLMRQPHTVELNNLLKTLLLLQMAQLLPMSQKQPAMEELPHTLKYHHHHLHMFQLQAHTEHQMVDQSHTHMSQPQADMKPLPM